MHIPPYHKKRSWQIFLIGSLMGSIFAYTIFVFMHGKMYENLLTENIQLKTTITELERQNEALLEDKEDLEEKGHTIQSITVSFTNHKELRLDRLIIHDLEDLIKKEINYIIGKEVKSIADNEGLLITLLENKKYTIDDLSYQFEVQKLFITDKVNITLKVKSAN